MGEEDTDQRLRQFTIIEGSGLLNVVTELSAANYVFQRVKDFTHDKIQNRRFRSSAEIFEDIIQILSVCKEDNLKANGKFLPEDRHEIYTAFRTGAIEALREHNFTKQQIFTFTTMAKAKYDSVVTESTGEKPERPSPKSLPVLLSPQPDDPT
jgi:hypothetical protein